MAKPRCPTCRSRKWTKEASSGRLTCDQGHVFEGYRKEMNERTEQVAHVTRKRTIRSTRQKKEKKSKANPILYHGERARYHYFQCLQMILRLQIQTLRELWSLPVEFEAICRDSWALHLSLLPTPPNPEPYLYAQEQGGFGPQEKAAKDQNNDETNEKDSPDEVDTTNIEGEDGEAAESDSDSAASRGSEDPEPEPDIRTQNHDDKSDPEQNPEEQELEDTGRNLDDEENEESDAPREGRSREVDKDQLKARSRKKGKSTWRKDDTPVGTVAVLVYACWTMRVPVIYQDFIRLIETYRLPYLDPVRLLNPSLTRHLTKHMKQALSPHFAPSTILLHRLASRIAHGAFLKYGIFTPELNAAPVLWRAVRHMGGNATLYGMTKSLARFLELPLTLNPVLAPPGSVLRNITAHNRRASQSRSRSTSPSKTSRSHSRTGQSSTGSGSSGQHTYDNVPPEVAFAAVCVVALKLCYGLNDGRIDFQPRGAWDPLCNMPSVEAYLSHLHELCALQAADSDILKGRKNEAFGTSDPALPGALEETDIDAYLEFCERALLGAHPDEEEAGNTAVEIFPLQREGMEEGRERDGEEEEAENNPMHGEGGGRSIRRELQEGRVLPAISLSVIEEDSPAASANVSRVAPGELYAVYSAHDVLGKLPEAYSLVLGRAAGWCGTDDEELGLVVERFERRLVRLYEQERRREREQQ